MAGWLNNWCLTDDAAFGDCLPKGDDHQSSTPSTRMVDCSTQLLRPTALLVGHAEDT